MGKMASQRLCEAMWCRTCRARGSYNAGPLIESLRQNSTNTTCKPAMVHVRWLSERGPA